MTTGKSVHTEIKAKITELENQQDKLSWHITQSENKIDTLAKERESAIGKLAHIYLPEMTPSAIHQTLREVQGEVQQLFQEKQETRKRLEDLMQKTSQRSAKLQEKLTALDEQLEEKAAERDKVQALVAQELLGHNIYKELQPKAQQAQEKLAQNKNRHEVFTADAEKKLIVYNEHQIFQYLIARQYGTPDYNGSALTRGLDKWVARLISYSQAKSNYDFLLAMPGAIKAEIKNRQEEVDKVLGEMKTIEDDIVKKHGLPKILEEGAKLGQTRSALMADIEKCNAEYHKYAKDREELHNTKGEYHQRALSTLKDFLKGNTLAELKRRARATTNPEDDALVTRLEEGEEEIKAHKGDAKRYQKELNELSEKLGGLKSVETSYTKNDFESSRSYFTSSFDIASLLKRYMLGELSSGDAFKEMEKYQKFKPRETYSSSSSSGGLDLAASILRAASRSSSSSSWGSSSSSSSSSWGSSSSSSSSWSSGGGFSSGGSSTGGGFGGGGFSSGGGF